MKTKKFLSMLVAITMLLICFGITAMAEESAAVVAKIGEQGYESVQAAIDAAKAGDTVTIKEGTYSVPTLKAGITVVGEGKVLLAGTLSGTLENLTLKNLHIKGGNAQRWAYAKGDCVFENVTFEATSVYALHFDGITEGTMLLYENCTIIGWAAMGGSPASCVFDGCTIKGNGAYGVIRTYFPTTIKNCTFDVANVNTTDVFEDGIHAVDAKIEVENCTNANGNMKDILNVSGEACIYVDGNLALANVAKVGDNYYTTLADALEAAKDKTEIVIELIDDATLDITAWQTMAIGGETTTKITINGNGNTLTFNKKNSDWNNIATNNNATLILNNMTITDSGYNNGPWNRYDLNFACDVELNSVKSTKALAFKADATLNDVEINEVGDNYAIWIQPNGQTVKIDRLTVNSAGRGIKIDDQYVGNAGKVTLSVNDATFTTAKKAAILVKSAAGADITATNYNITNVAADSANLVWVDEDGASAFNKVIVNGAPAVLEGGAPDLPTATVTKVENKDLTFALNFKADAASEAQLAYYGNWYADYVLTVNKNVTFNANDEADGYLSGQYEAWSENWVNVPFEDVTLKAGESIKIMEYAATLMGQPGLKYTYGEVYQIVKDFNCGVFFDEEFLTANPDLEVTLELRMYNPDESKNESYVIGETYTFKAPVVEEESPYIFGKAFYMVDLPEINGRYQVGLYAGIDSLKYKKVGFKIYDQNDKIIGEDSTNKVYSSVKGNNMTVTAKEIDSFRIFGTTVEFGKGWDNIAVFFRPYAIDFTGKEILGYKYKIADIYTATPVVE